MANRVFKDADGDWFCTVGGRLYGPFQHINEARAELERQEGYEKRRLKDQTYQVWQEKPETKGKFQQTYEPVLTVLLSQEAAHAVRIVLAAEHPHLTFAVSSGTPIGYTF